MADKKKFDKIEEKLDKISEHLSDIDKTLVRNTSSLDEHIRRTNLLEEKMLPVEKHVTQVNGALKLIGVISLLLSIFLALKGLLHL